ncbi:hypothetical protein WJ438_35000 [Streptomyces sp. GD-15H]|uniref:hypothetical protein n=1 Tax=Streptomyces sp. GD-15H TaxID=3129112 RepID=UPI00324C2490
MRDYPPGQGSTLTIGGRASFALLLRVPSWATEGFRATVNGHAASGTPAPGACFRCSEPHLIFGTPGSGASSPSRSGDGVTPLDEIWTRVPFGNKKSLVTRVRTVVAAWVSAGLPSGTDNDKVARTAQNALYEA